MLRGLQLYRAVGALLTGALVLAAWNGAFICHSCPRQASAPSHCAKKAASNEPHHSVTHETATLRTEQFDQCSHCVTHLPSQANSSPAVVFNNPSHGIVADYPSFVAVRFSPPANTIEIHDHGPPGPVDPHYVLNHTFRI